MLSYGRHHSQTARRTHRNCGVCGEICGDTKTELAGVGGFHRSGHAHLSESQGTHRPQKDGAGKSVRSFADLCLTTWLRRRRTANLMLDSHFCNQRRRSICTRELEVGEDGERACGRFSAGTASGSFTGRDIRLWVDSLLARSSARSSRRCASRMSVRIPVPKWTCTRGRVPSKAGSTEPRRRRLGWVCS